MKTGMLAAEAVWDKIQADDSETQGIEPTDLSDRVKNRYKALMPREKKAWFILICIYSELPLPIKFYFFPIF